MSLVGRPKERARKAHRDAVRKAREQCERDCQPARMRYLDAIRPHLMRMRAAVAEADRAFFEAEKERKAREDRKRSKKAA